MKFCTSCNNQLDDNAMFCSACGAKQEAPVVEAIPTAPVVEENTPAKEKGGIFTLFGFIGDLMAIVSAFFAVASLAAANLDINVYISSFSSSGINAYGHIETGAGCAVLSFLLSMGVIATGVLSLISSLKNHEGQKGLFKSIKKLTIGTFLFILGIILMVHI